MKRILLALLVSLCAAVSTPLLIAQETASLTGVVSDNTGAILTDVVVKLVDTKTNTNYEAKTNAQGSYTFAKLLPGPGYQITFTKDGFDSLLLSNIYIGVGTVHTENVKMQVGKITETVEVSDVGQSATLDTTDATISTNFDMKVVQDLPIQGRSSVIGLLALEPGVVTANASSDDPIGSRDGVVTGARSDQTNVTLDGLDINDFSTGQSFTTVGNAPVDSIQEFHGETAMPMSASGRGSGAQVQLVTISGTNTWHGGVNEYLRNTVTEANNIFNTIPPNTKPVPKLNRNQFGAKLGGPVVKDKLFFFFDYQGQRDAREDSVLYNNIPLDTFRNGQVGYINNGPDCDTGSRVNIDPACISYKNAADLATIDPQGVGINQNLLDFINARYPHVNDPTGGDGVNTGGFRFNSAVHRTVNDYVARVDYNLTSKMKLFGRTSIVRDSGGDDTNFAAPFHFPGDPITHSVVDHSYAYVVGHTWTINNNMVNNFFYGVTRSDLNFPVTFNPVGTSYFQVFGPFSLPFDQQESQHRIIPIPVYRDDFTWVRGKHNYQFGGTFKPIKTDSNQVNDLNFVTMGVGGDLPNLRQTPSDTLRPTDILQDSGTIAAGRWDTAFTTMLGRFANIGSNFNNGPDLNPIPQGTGHTRNYRYYETEVYWQDTFRMRDDLTMTYGLRYQYYSVPYEVHGLEAIPNVNLAGFFDPRAADALTGGQNYQLETYNFGGKANHAPGLYEPDWKDFAPRFAIAYNPRVTSGFFGHLLGDRKTVIRAGSGLIFDHPVTNAVNFIQDQANYIFQNASTTAFGGANSGPTTNGPTKALLNDPRFTDINTLPTINSPAPVTVPFTPFDIQGLADGQANYAVDSHLKTPYSIATTVGIQRELPGNFLLETSYVGRYGRRLLAQADAGQVVNTVDPASGQSLMTAFSAMTKESRAGVSSFTTQPFFENQVSAALGDTCEDFFGDTCTNVVGFGLQGFVDFGDTTDFIQNLYRFPLLLPGVGLHPQFGSNVYIANKSFSAYNGLLVTLHKRPSHGLQFDFNYTFSHSIDNLSAPINNVFGTSNLSGGIICDITDLSKCRGNSDFDVTHLISGDWIYDLPIGKGRQFGSAMPGWANQIVGGWQLSGTVTGHSGFAFTNVSGAFPISFFTNAPGTFIGTQSDIATKIHFTDKGFQLFKDQDRAMSAFRGPIGLEGGTRNNLRGPAYLNFAMGLSKQFPIKERFIVRFRADAFNVFNHVNFGLPGTGGSGGTADITDQNSFGIIHSTASMRSMQFALRLDF